MTRFQTTEDVRNFCSSVASLAAELGDESMELMLQEALAVGNTSSPTERLWYTIVGLAAAVEVMDDRYPDDLIAEIREAIDLGREWIRRANSGQPWKSAPSADHPSCLSRRLLHGISAGA